MSGLSRHDFRLLFEQLRGPIYRFLLRLCRDRSDAEDLLQETFLTVWRKRAQYRGDGSAEGYVRKTAIHIFLNRRRKQTRRDAIARDAGGLIPGPSHTAPAAVEGVAVADTQRFVAARVREVLDTLPTSARETFIFFRHGGLTCREIAALVGAPIKTIESRLRRATQEIRTALGRHKQDLTSR